MPTKKNFPFKFTPTNQDPRGYKNYQDHTVNDRMDPKATRKDLAFERYMLLGQFSEIQLVGFDDYGNVVYRLVNSPDMHAQYNATVIRQKGNKVQVNFTDLNEFTGNTVAQRKVYSAMKQSFIPLKGGNVSDMDLIYDAWDLMMKLQQQVIDGLANSDYSTKI